MLNACRQLSALALSSRILSMSFYAVRTGRTTGIFSTWPECESQVKGFPGARYKKFKSQSEAQEFVDFKPSSKPAAAKSSMKASSSLKTSAAAASKPYARPTSSPKAIPSTSGTALSKPNKMALSKPRKTKLIEPLAQSSAFSTSCASATQGKVMECFTDGSCRYNGRKGAYAGIGVYWGPDNAMNIAEPLAGRKTNNRAEIHAARRAVLQAKAAGATELIINTDSQFLINSITKWINKWKKNDWTLADGGKVQNMEDFKQLDAAMFGLKVQWRHVAGHAGVHGNEQADKLANEGAAKTVYKTDYNDEDEDYFYF